MSLKDKLSKFKKDLLTSIQFNRDYEFEATLEDHPIGNQNIMLIFIELEKVGDIQIHIILVL